MRIMMLSSASQLFYRISACKTACCFADIFARRRIYRSFRMLLQSVAALLSIMKAGLSDLLFPRSCVGCGAWDQYVCDVCERKISPEWQDVAQIQPFILKVSTNDGSSHAMFPCFSLMHYSGVSRRIMIAWKHAYSRGLDLRICEIWRKHMRELCTGALSFTGVYELSGLDGDAERSKDNKYETVCRGEQKQSRAMGEKMGENICFVPAPSKWQRRYEGRLVAAKLAGESSRVCGYPVRDVLRVRSRIGDMWSRHWEKIKQTILGTRRYLVSNRTQRSHKRHSIYVCQRLDGMRVILVDDVVTTGATAAGAAWAVQQAGGEVVGMLAFASVSRHGEVQTDVCGGEEAGSASRNW